MQHITIPNSDFSKMTKMEKWREIKNVIFELGMATALNKLNFMLVYPNKIPANLKNDYPPKPFGEIEYIPYELNSNAIIKTIKEKILPAIKEELKHKEKLLCSILNAKCPHEDIKSKENKIFVGLPYGKHKAFFQEIESLLKRKLNKYVLEFFKPAESLSGLCQLCKEVGKSSFCIIDTTSNDITMIFALGIAFGKGKKFIQLHDTDLSPNRPISDLRNWAIEYRNIKELEDKLDEELPKRLRK